jgi:hypothetical protein
VVLLAPFVSAASTVLARKPFMMNLSSLWSWSDVFVMRQAAMEQGHATFVAHGTVGEVIPIAHGRAIERWVARHSNKTQFVAIPDATHSSIRESKAVYQELSQFLTELN